MACTPEVMFHEWLCKTNFSFLVGASYPEELIQAAEALGYSSLCVNDMDGVYGLARAFTDWKHLKKQGHVSKLKLHYGAEIHLQEDHESPLLQQQTLALNVLSKRGYRNLNRLISRMHQETKNKSFLTPEQLLEADLEDLFIVVPMRGGFQWLFQQREWARQLYEKMSGRCHLAVTKTLNSYSDRLISQVYQFAEQESWPVVFSQDAFFHHRNQKSFHDLLLAIRANQKIEDSVSLHLPNGERSFHSLSVLHHWYRDLPDYQKTLHRMRDLSEMSQFCLSELRYEYPKEWLPEGFSAQEYLEKVTWEGLRDRYQQKILPRLSDLIRRELKLIEDLQFADYFLTVWDIVRWARDQNILCQGRGSAANSAVCFALGITSCDPTLFDLLFERFISKERGDPPDIDIDFEHERREEVIQYIYRRYGRARAAMLANVITFKKKGAVRATGKALGVSDSVLKSLSETIQSPSLRGQSLTNMMLACEKSLKRPDLPWSLWRETAQRLKGFPHHLGLHSGGFIISQDPIEELVAQEPATMPGRTVIQWAKDDIEELGFFKIDCLALGMLTALRKAFSYIETCYGEKLELYKVPQEDPATYSMIQKAKTEGVFQIESRAQMSMLPRLKPRTFYDLVIEIAIIRPGPIQGKVIHPYLRRRDGLEPVTYPDPSVQSILSKTLGVIIFQEQLMRIAIALGDFTPGESDALRKQIGAWNSKSFDRNLNPYLEKLFSGMRKRKIPQHFIDQTVEHMKGFAHYGFPESHAISFAFIAYASCYLKCHYPAAFYTAILNSQPMGFYSPHALLQSAKRDGIEVLPISVQHSHWDHTLELLEEGFEHKPPRYGLRLGFRLIKGLSESSMREVVQKREVVGVWTSFDQFLQTVRLYRDEFTALAASNAFACFGMNRFEAIWKAEAVPYRELVDIEEKQINWKKLNTLETSQLDFQSTGVSIEIHPVEQMREHHWNYNIQKQKVCLAQNLVKLPNKKSVSVFGLVLVRQAPPSAKGMIFYTLEDETGFLNLALTPQVYHKFAYSLDRAGFLCVTGQLQKVGAEYASILVSEVHTEKNLKIEALTSPENSLHPALVLQAPAPRNFR